MDHPPDFPWTSGKAPAYPLNPLGGSLSISEMIL